MKISAVRSLIVISLVTALVVAGTTMAWFTDEYNLPYAAEMVVGTLEFEITDASVIAEGSVEGEDGGELEDGEQSETLIWQAGECKEFSWTFRNTGSKKAFFRARIEGIFTHYTGEETAWGEGTRFNKKGSWAMYFTHNAGSVTTTRLLAGQHHDAGTIRVWEEGGKLYVCYETNENWKMTETQLAVAEDKEGLPLNASGNPALGQFPYKNNHDLVGSYTYVINPSPDYSPVFIAAHAVVAGGAEIVEYDEITWSLPDGSLWKEGVDTEGRPDGWYYYCQPVRSGEKITLVLRGCLDDDAAGGSCEVKLKAESVQASHGAAKEIWPSWPVE